MFARHIRSPDRVSGLDELAARLRADVERLARPRHIWAQPEANAQTREDLAERLRSLGSALPGRPRSSRPTEFSC